MSPYILQNVKGAWVQQYESKLDLFKATIAGHLKKEPTAAAAVIKKTRRGLCVCNVRMPEHSRIWMKSLGSTINMLLT